MVHVIKQFIMAITAAVSLTASVLLLQHTNRSLPSKTVSQEQILGYNHLYCQSKQAFYTSLLSKPWGYTANEYLAQQASQELELFKELYAILGIDEQAFNEAKSELYDDYIQSQHRQYCEVSARAHREIGAHHELIQEFIDKHNINIPTITVIPTKEMGIAAATQSNLYIDDATIIKSGEYKLTEQAQADILHEMQHILHDDSFNIYVMRVLLHRHADAHGTTIKQYKNLLSRFDKFREKRADILAGLVDPKLTRVAADFYANKIVLGEKGMCDTHPCHATRYDYLNTLHTQIVKELKTQEELKNV